MRDEDAGCIPLLPSGFLQPVQEQRRVPQRRMLKMPCTWLHHALVTPLLILGELSHPRGQLLPHRADGGQLGSRQWWHESQSHVTHS